jgi:hypothetical protein
VSADPIAEPRCTVCHTSVAPSAARCPNCGLSHPTRVLARGGLWLVAVALLAGWLLTFAVVASAR